MLEGKSSAELESLEGEIERAATAPGATETEYWTAVLRRVGCTRRDDGRGGGREDARRARAQEVPPPPQQRRRKSSGPSGAEEASDDEDLSGGLARAMGDASGPGDERDPEGDRPREGEGEPTPDIRPGRSRSRSPGGYTPDGSPGPRVVACPRGPGVFSRTPTARGGGRGGGRGAARAARGLAREAKLGRFAGVAGGVEAARRGDRDAFEAFKDRDARNAEAADGAALAPPRGGRRRRRRRRRRLRARVENDRGAEMGEKAGGAEVAFAGEAAPESQAYWWHDKYRRAKPRFNRVHTPVYWNKYNQTCTTTTTTGRRRRCRGTSSTSSTRT